MQKLSNPGNNMRFFILFCLVLAASADSSEEVNVKLAIVMIETLLFRRDVMKTVAFILRPKK